MTWICPWCGRENLQDERIGRQEPHCTICSEKRITPEELEKKRDRAISDLENGLEKISDRAQCIKGRMFSVQEQIFELESDLNQYREELEAARAEAAPLTVELDKWKDTVVFYEKCNRAVFAEKDPQQAKLPFEVAA